ncbi:aspartate kinase [Candidatus Liberibacter americanus]|uniref:Aspartokinase n=1 Tax=Candidatus Liberibacter americanus str. Sao Paulo TaxID=1261131 RepID=U6B4V8_9HYPH|nr:aspartate kinase [Candidatus Liberibacter americanus]AHA27930.1 Aspartokinase [Candidatus Liberibacter americanus str. Sao Paulo]EMS36071.1 aspartate kinase [Candidatus Liberibacter americanus PW_SP]
MARIVMKFGGTSVANIDCIHNVALHVKREVDMGQEVAVVVSAMKGETDRLTSLCRKVASNYSKREHDVVVSSGEQVSAGLTAIALQSIGIDVLSLQGWQIPILTDCFYGSARVLSIKSKKIISQMKKGKVVVIPGFQGVDHEGFITTLGRGGSDTSAVAIAAAIEADRCDIYTDVDGIYTTDPRIEPKALLMKKISFEEMLEMSSLGAKVLQVRSVELAMLQKVCLSVRSSFVDQSKFIDTGQELPGTLICSEEEIMEKEFVTGIAYTKDEAQISLRRLQDRPGVSASIFSPLAAANINVDMIVQNISENGKYTDMTFTTPSVDLEKALSVLADNKDKIGYDVIQHDDNLVKISAIGVGMRSHAGVASDFFLCLADKGINIKAITTSEIKISVLIDSSYTELAVRSLHSCYGLDK